MDSLTTLLSHFSLHAGVFYTGNICGVHDFHQDALRGHLHLVKRGAVQVMGAQPAVISITEPTLLFLPRPQTHRLLADSQAGSDVVCGTVQFGSGGHNPITDSLPNVVRVALADLPGAEALMTLMFDEAFSEQLGGQAALNRLCEVLVIRLLRHCLEQGLTQGGALAGLADPRLAKVLRALHKEGERPWTLADMAALAGMSRARFALYFHEITGETPAHYLVCWRVMRAQSLLRRGVPLKHVAYEVGYSSASALARAFMRELTCSPTQWLKAQQARPDTALFETNGQHNETFDTSLKRRID